MFTLINNIKEIKDFSLKKIQFILIFTLLFLFYIKEFHEVYFISLYENIENITMNLNYYSWEYLIMILQLFLILSMVITLILVILLNIFDNTLWKYNERTKILSLERIIAKKKCTQLYVDFSIWYFIILGYNYLFDGNYINNRIIIFIASWSILMLFIKLFLFLFATNDDDWIYKDY